MSLSFSLGHLLKDSVINKRTLCQNQFAGRLLQLIYFLCPRNLKTGQLLKKMHIGDSYQASVCHKAYSEMVSNDLLGPLCVLLLASLSESNNLVSSNYLALPGAYFFFQNWIAVFVLS